MRLANVGVVMVLSSCQSEEAPTSESPLSPGDYLPSAPPLPGPANVTSSPVDIGYAPPPGFRAPPYVPPVPQASASASPNAIIPRAAWTNSGPAKPCLPMGGVALLTFHHDGDPTPFASDDYGQTAQYLERIRTYHVHSGFEDIGYHYAIDRAGRVWELRSVLLRGEHVRAGLDANHRPHKWNDHNVGVVVLGNFMLQTPTSAQMQRICAFGKQLRQRYRLQIAQVKVHQELVTTECPGIHLRPYMDQVRARQMI